MYDRCRGTCDRVLRAVPAACLRGEENIGGISGDLGSRESGIQMVRSSTSNKICACRKSDQLQELM